MTGILTNLPLESLTRSKTFALRLVATLLLAAISVVFGVGSATAQCINYGDYMHWVNSVEVPHYPVSVTTEGDYLYVAGDFGLIIMDIDAPENPVTVGGVGAVGFAEDVAVSGSYAYVLGDGSGGSNSLHVVDVSDPTSPVIVGSTNGGFSIDAGSGVAIAGDYAYVTGYLGLHVIDVSDPLNPIAVGNVNTPGSAAKVAVDGNYAYVADRAAGLQVIDVSDPLNPAIVGNLPMDFPVAVRLSGGYAYVPDQNSLYVVDISTPHSPMVVASADLRRSGGYLDIVGHYAYVSGLSVVDISDPTNPVEVGAVGGTGLFGVAASAGYAYGVPGLHVIDVTNPENPDIVGSVDLSGFSTVVEGDYAYVAAWDAGLKVVDVSVPETPVVVAGVDTPDYAHDVTLSGNYAYLADIKGLLVIDITNPLNPLIVGNVDTPDQAFGVVVAGNYAYVADGPSGLLIIDITDPTNPVIEGSVDTGYARNVDILGDHAYVVGEFPGLSTPGMSVVDVTISANPVVVGTVETPGDVMSVEVAGRYAYIVGGGLQIVDIANPTLPVIVGTASTRRGWDVAVSGIWVYVKHTFGLIVFNVVDPESPRLVGGLDTVTCSSESGGVFLTGSYAYVADGCGFRIVPLQCQTVAAALQGSSSRWTGRHVEVTWQLIDIAGELTFEISRRENGTNDLVLVDDAEVTSRGGEFVFADHSTRLGTTYHYRVGILESGELVTAFETEVTTPAVTLLLKQNQPNPFNPTTRIVFSLDREMPVRFSIHDVAGRLVTTLVDQRMIAGEHVVEWNGQDARGERVASGVYFYRLTAGKRTLTRKAVMLK